MKYKFLFTHTEESIRTLSIMQYKLFETKIRIIRDITAAVVLIAGVLSIPSWWAALLICYGSFLITGKYNTPRRKADKLIKAMNEANAAFPSSRYGFDEYGIHIFETKRNKEEDVLPYKDIYGLGEDKEYLFFFRDRYGGYMISKKDLEEKEGIIYLENFKEYIESRTNKKFIKSKIPILMFFEKLKQLRQNFHK